MIKRLHEITLKDVILLDATKSANVLKKYWFIPLFLCRKELEKLAKDIFTSIGGQTVTSLQDEFDKVMMYRKLQIYEALYKAVQIELGLKPKINAFKIIIEKDYKDSPQLERVLSEVEKWTGIKIETPEDLQTFEDWIQHKIDKYAEMFPVETSEDKQEIPLIEVFNSVFLFFNLPPNENALLITWLALKKQAEDRIASQSNNSENGE